MTELLELVGELRELRREGYDVIATLGTRVKIGASKYARRAEACRRAKKLRYAVTYRDIRKMSENYLPPLVSVHFTDVRSILRLARILGFTVLAESEDDERECARCCQPFRPIWADEKLCDRCWVVEHGPPHR